jgi:hypothetical protein
MSVFERRIVAPAPLRRAELGFCALMIGAAGHFRIGAIN